MNNSGFCAIVNHISFLLEVAMKKLIVLVVGFMLFVSSIVSVVPFEIKNVEAATEFRLNAAAGNEIVRLWWDEVPGATQGYYLYRGNSSGGQYLMPLTDFGILGNTYFDTNVTNDTNYCYYARAIDENATPFARSNEVCVSVKPDLPTFVEPCKLVLTFTIDSAKYLVNGVEKEMSTPCIIENNRTFLLIRYVAEEVGGKVLWDGTERKVTVIYKDKTIEMWIGKSNARVNGVNRAIDPNNPRVVPFIKNDRTHIPLRFPVESFGEGEVKWFATTKQAVLTFPDRCEETKEGILVRYSDSTGLGQLTGFNGEPYLLANMNRLENRFKPAVGDCLRVIGRNDNPDYPGYLFGRTAELIACPDDGIKYWSGRITKLDCVNGQILFEDEKEKIFPIKFSTGNSLMSSFCRKLQVDDCIRVSGRWITPASATANNSFISPINIEKIDCPGEIEEYKCDGDWFSGRVLEVDCMGNKLVVELESGDIVDVTLPRNADCTTINPTWCVRFCGTRMSTDKIIAQILTAFPCDDEICDGEKFVGKVISVSEENGILKLSQGDTYISFDILGLPAEDFKDFKCAEVCAYRVQSSEIVTNVSWKWVALSVKEADCENSCDGRVIQVRVERISKDCSEMLVKTLDTGKVMSLIIEDKSLCNLEIGACYEICLRPNVKCLCAISAVKIDCPIECGGMQVTGVIKGIEKGQAVIELYGATKIYKFSITPAQERKLSTGMCVEVCLKFELSGSATLTWFRELDPEECGSSGEKVCDDLELLVHIKDVDCKKKEMKIKIVDGPSMMKGMEIAIPVDESVMNCEEIEKDTCMKICGRLKGFSNFELLWWEIVDPEDCGIKPEPEPEPCDETVKGIIKYLGCREDDKIDLEIDGETKTFLSKGIEVCKGFEVGDCVLACLKNIPGAPPIILSMKKLDPSECPRPEPECVKKVTGRIVDIGCTAHGYLKINVNGGISEYTIRDIDACEGFDIGDCVIVCLINDDQGNILVDWMDTVSDENCPPKEKPECNEYVKINVSNVYCENRYIGGVEALTVEARTPMPLTIKFENAEFCRMQADRCYEVCVWRDSDGVLWGESFKEIDCMGEFHCEGRQIDVTVIKTNCKEGWVAFNSNGEIIQINTDSDFCNYAEPGMCLTLCLERDEEGTTKILDYKFLVDEECPGQDCVDVRWISGQVITMDSSDELPGLFFTLYGFRTPIFYPVDQSMGLLEFREGDCIKVCIKYDPAIGHLVSSYLIVLPDDMCAGRCEDGEIWRGNIQSINQADGIINLRKGDSFWSLKVADKLIQRFEVGDCIVACGIWQPENQVFVTQWIRHLPPELCSNQCEGQVVEGKLIDVVPDNRMIVLQVGEKAVEIFIDGYYIDNLEPGVCLRVCTTWWDVGTGVFYSSWFEAVECVDSPPCDGNLIRGIVASHDDRIMVWVNGNKFEVTGIETKMQFPIGACVEICGFFAQEGAGETHTAPITISASWMSILPDEDCEGEVDIWVGILHEVDELGRGVIKRDGKSFEIHIPKEDLPYISEEMCVKARGLYILERQLFLADWVAQVVEEECKWCDDETLKTTLVHFDEENNVGYIVHGGYLDKVIFTYPVLYQPILNEIPQLVYPICVELCGSWDGPFYAHDTRVLSQSECALVCSGLTFTGVVEEFIPEEKLMKLEYLKDKDKGFNYPKFLRIPPYINFEVGMCVSVCTQPMTNLDTMVDMLWYPVVVWGEYLSPEECIPPEPEPCEKEIKGIIKYLGCREDDKIRLEINGDVKTFMSDGVEVCRGFEIGDCVSACIKKTSTKLPVILRMEKLNPSECPIPEPEPEEDIWNGTITRTYCIEDLLYCEIDGKTYMVAVPENIKCEAFKIGDCVKIIGNYDEKYQVINATSIEKAPCKEKTESWDMIIFDTICTRTKTPYYLARIETTFYEVYLPAGFKCATFSPGDCITVEGYMKSRGSEIGTPTDFYIKAVSIKSRKCDSWGPYPATIVATYCDSHYMRVKYYDSEYNLYYPKSFVECGRLKKGDCINFKGVIWTKGYIDADWVGRTDCPQKTETHTLFVRNLNHKTSVLTGIEGIKTYNVKISKPFSIRSYSIGSCIKVTGTVTKSTGTFISAPTITPTKIDKVACPKSSKFTVKVTKKACLVIGGSPYLEVTYMRSTYKLFFISRYDCDDFVVNGNYDVTGYVNMKSKYIHATSLSMQMGTPIPFSGYSLGEWNRLLQVQMY
jgi:Copper amine oxidase N-terminal domain